MALVIKLMLDIYTNCMSGIDFCIILFIVPPFHLRKVGSFLKGYYFQERWGILSNVANDLWLEVGTPL